MSTTALPHEEISLEADSELRFEIETVDTKVVVEVRSRLLNNNNS